MYYLGIKNKQMASHELNLSSSRSHSIFEIHFEILNLKNDEILKNKICLVDLAGSEKLKMFNFPKKEFVKESIEINSSLLSLGKVINCLSNEKLIQHIPYRESKLTKILKQSLGGNTYTFMIACISQSDLFVEENLNTLYYASRAKNIKNTPIINEDPKDGIIRKLKEEV